MALTPGGWIAWLLVGAIAGWLAGQMVAGGGFGIIGDIVVGLIGAVIGGWLFSVFLPGSSAGFLGSIAVAFVGAVILVAIVRTLTRKRRFSL
ncbi:MAG TPA: GlsB/YeaQ/YmgE family stress response membrane protein [Chloroflexota bacterium]|nr:GlsB/YeaQ/YmgE family stress response membrane protein [Chloroflexota bacterium]